MSRYRFCRRAVLAAVATCMGIGLSAPAAPTTVGPLTPDTFDKLHAQIRPQAGESRYLEIPWLLSVHEARVRAAADGKPILLWAGWNGAPVGVC